MVEIDKPRIECIDSPEDPAHGSFYRGAARAGLRYDSGQLTEKDSAFLSACTAATSIKIAGVQHEFSTIPV